MQPFSRAPRSGVGCLRGAAAWGGTGSPEVPVMGMGTSGIPNVGGRRPKAAICTICTICYLQLPSPTLRRWRAGRAARGAVRAGRVGPGSLPAQVIPSNRPTSCEYLRAARAGGAGRARGARLACGAGGARGAVVAQVAQVAQVPPALLESVEPAGFVTKRSRLQPRRQTGLRCQNELSLNLTVILNFEQVIETGRYGTGHKLCLFPMNRSVGRLS